MGEVYREIRVRIPIDVHEILKKIREETNVPIVKVVEYAVVEYVNKLRVDVPVELKIAYLVRKIFEIRRMMELVDMAASAAKSIPRVTNEEVLPILYELDKLKTRLYDKLVEAAKDVEAKLGSNLEESARFSTFVARVYQRRAREEERMLSVVKAVVNAEKMKEEEEDEEKEEENKEEEGD